MCEVVSCHAVTGRCSDARSEATHLCDLVSSNVVYTVFATKAPICAFCVHVADCMLRIVYPLPNYLATYLPVYYVVFFAACISAGYLHMIKSV